MGLRLYPKAAYISFQNVVVKMLSKDSKRVLTPDQANLTSLSPKLVVLWMWSELLRVSRLARAAIRL